MTRTDVAVSIFSGGLSCSQAVLVAFCDVYNVDKQIALRLSAGFGGGVKVGEICGAVSGAIMVVGLRYGQVDGEDKEARRVSDERVREFLQLFRKRNGHITCRDLLREMADMGSDADRKQQFKAQRCTELVRDAAEILEQLQYGTLTHPLHS